MADSRHEQLRRLFDRALELPAAARATFLDDKCRDDADLRRRLEGMLAAADDAHFLAAPTAPIPAPAPPAPGAEAPLREGPGTRIGPYKLLQLIGEGGFGAVFMAEQEQPVVRKVALKIIKLGMDTRQVVARFEQERQALAMMDHPNIARVLDAGATATGRPYFVMDLVKGDPIVDYCDKNNLPIDERLELFAQVCGAVQHAHGKGIIHRDLKPSNILVGTQDGRPMAKVIDFGIAKATSSKLTDKTLFTEHQQVIGTLQYMSPEQAEGSLDIDTRTDVYSLGVLLYELLTGSTPFDKKTIQGAMYGELQRMIREVEPPKPSTRLSDSHDTLARIAAHRRTEPRRLGTLIRGELDWIVMKALEKDRSRRYETANGLAMDIRRYLSGEAVVAAPPSAVYRLRKFVRRNKATVAAGAAVAAALLAGVVAFAWQASIAQRERDTAVLAQRAEASQHRIADEQRALADAQKAEAQKQQGIAEANATAEAKARAQADLLAKSEAEQRRIAESSGRKAAAINQFLLDMLGAADLRELGREVKVAQALDRAAAGVGKAFADRPDVEAAVRQIVGRTYLSIGVLDQAAPQIDAARELVRKLHGEASVEFARSLNDLGELQRQKGELTAAAASCQRAAEIALQQRGAEDALTLESRVEYANILVQLHREAEAETILREVLATRTRLLGREHADTLISINSLAVLLHNLQRLDEAEPLYREATAAGARVLGAEHPDTITARMNLASILRSRGNLTEAEPLMAATYASLKQVFGESHTKTASAAMALAGLYNDQGRYQQALPFYEQAVAIRRRAEGENSEAVTSAKVDLAMALTHLGDHTRAATVQHEVVDTRTRNLGAEHRDTLFARLDLANTLARTDRKAEAETILKELLEVCPRLFGEDDEISIISTNSYAVLLLGLDRFADAEPYLRKALEVGRRAEGPDHKHTIITQLNFSVAVRELGRLDEADAVGRDALERFTRVFGAKHPNTATAHTDLAETLVKLGRNDEARQQLAEAVAVKKAALGARNAAFAGDALLLARLLLDTGHADEAEPILREVVEVQAQARGAGDRRTVNARVELGRCLWLLHHFADAEPLLVDGHPLLLKALPAGQRDVSRAERYLAEFYAAWNTAEPDAARATKAAEWQAKAPAVR